MNSTLSFVSEATKIHGNLYDYSRVVYVNAKTKVELVCQYHGSFFVTPNNHVSKGTKCAKCSMSAVGFSKRKSQENYLNQVKEIHGDKYDYSKVTYVNSTTPIEILCKTHGSFFKTAVSHLSQGCPRCADRYRKQNDWLTFVGIPDNQQHRQVRLRMTDGSHIVADGFDYLTNTVYEFWGDKWHGNLSVLSPSNINPVTKLTYQTHWDLTYAKIQKIKNSGYHLNQIWESQWTSIVKSPMNGIVELLSSIYKNQ